MKRKSHYLPINLNPFAWAEFQEFVWHSGVKIYDSTHRELRIRRNKDFGQRCLINIYIYMSVAGRFFFWHSTLSLRFVSKVLIAITCVWRRPVTPAESLLPHVYGRPHQLWRMSVRLAKQPGQEAGGRVGQVEPPGKATGNNAIAIAITHLPNCSCDPYSDPDTEPYSVPMNCVTVQVKLWI